MTQTAVHTSVDQQLEGVALQVFDGVTVLDKEVIIYIPSLDRSGKAFNHPGLVNEVEQRFTAWFGGCTSTAANGSYGNVSEKITMVSSATTEAILIKHLREVFGLVQWLLKEFDQQEVAVKVNGKFMLLR